MCIKCLIEQVIEDIAGERPTEAVGTISKELAADFKTFRVERSVFKIDHKVRVLQARRDFKAGKIDEAQVDALQAEYDAMVEYENGRYENMHNELWDRLYAELNITEADRTARYAVNHTTGEVVKYVESEAHV
jgi:hypothetical protein